MIIITGAAGFIGSVLLGEFNRRKIYDILVADDFSSSIKNFNLRYKTFKHKIQRDNLINWIDANYRQIEFIFHIGARTDTAEFNKEVFNRLNLNYSKEIWLRCSKYNIPLIYASSAATYGKGELGYIDDHNIINKLKPLNPYGESKNEFDKWVLSQRNEPPFWVGLKFFNVFGPNEYHKARMSSVVINAFNQIINSGCMNLFKSHRNDFKDGEQKRDFIYVMDVIDVILFFYKRQKDSGIYNLGSGKARTFLDLARSVFKGMGLKEKINFIDIPEDIRERYQYFTEAKMDKLIALGYNKTFTSLEDGIEDYVKNYLYGHVYY